MKMKDDIELAPYILSLVSNLKDNDGIKFELEGRNPITFGHMC